MGYYLDLFYIGDLIMKVNEKGLLSLKLHEGFVEKVYKCTAGKDTIGYGYNLEANPLQLDKSILNSLYLSGISKEYAEELLLLTLEIFETKLQANLSWYDHLDSNRQWVLLNMAYNLGVDGLLTFKNTLAAIKVGDYEIASKMMLQSKWASQVKERANELSQVMITGNFV